MFIFGIIEDTTITFWYFLTFKEDAGELDAEDADTAVLHSRTGHMVEKKQEWFF